MNKYFLTLLCEYTSMNDECIINNKKVMKLRRNLTALALGLSTIAAVAQTGDGNLQIKEEGKTVFNPHWYMQVQAGASHTVGEAKFGDLISPAAAIYAGYQFTPLWGLRAGISGWEAKGAWANPLTVYKYNYLQGNVDATLDLSALFCGYNHKRVFNAYLFAGVGVNGAFNNDEAVALHNAGKKLEYLWTDSKVSPVGRFGLGTNLRLSDRVYFNIEVNGNVMSDKYNSKKAGNPDWQFNALAGFTFKFGKTHKKTEPVYYEPTPVAPVEQQPVQEVKEEPATTPAPVVEAMTQNVFFHINSAEIRTSEQSKIESLVSYLNQHTDAKVTVCGYADKETGTASINERLSKKRAEAVAKALQDKGIAASRITVDHKGDTVQPFGTASENRVTICIAE